MVSELHAVSIRNGANGAEEDNSPAKTIKDGERAGQVFINELFELGIPAIHRIPWLRFRLFRRLRNRRQ